MSQTLPSVPVVCLDYPSEHEVSFSPQGIDTTNDLSRQPLQSIRPGEK